MSKVGEWYYEHIIQEELIKKQKIKDKEEKIKKIKARAEAYMERGDNEIRKQ